MKIGVKIKENIGKISGKNTTSDSGRKGRKKNINHELTRKKVKVRRFGS